MTALGSLDTSPTEYPALHWHLTYNHFPAHPAFMVPVAAEALSKARQGQWSGRVQLPDGVQWKDGSQDAGVMDLCDAFHLWDMIDEDEA